MPSIATFTFVYQSYQHLLAIGLKPSFQKVEVNQTEDVLAS